MTETDDEALQPIENSNIIRSGRLHVGDGHELYWVDWGNKDVKNPIFFLHGGPGGGFDEKAFAFFNPKKQRVIFHDQRGSGRSTPLASVKHNTSSNLVNDITKLKAELGFDKISLYGFSWGATLALLYAIANPAVVEKMLIGGIYLARKEDLEYYLAGGVKTHFPEVWERFINTVPPKYRDEPWVYYEQKLQSSDERERVYFAKEWMIYEISLAQLDFVPELAESVASNFASPAMAYLEVHYLANNCFITEDYILSNVAKLHGIRTVILQGRYDFLCKPSTAFDLQRAIGDSATLQFVPAAHLRRDITYRSAVVAYTNALWS